MFPRPFSAGSPSRSVVRVDNPSRGGVAMQVGSSTPAMGRPGAGWFVGRGEDSDRGWARLRGGSSTGKMERDAVGYDKDAAVESQL